MFLWTYSDQIKEWRDADVHCINSLIHIFTRREKKQKIQDIRKNVKDAIVVSELLIWVICF